MMVKIFSETTMAPERMAHAINDWLKENPIEIERTESAFNPRNGFVTLFLFYREPAA